MSKILVDISNLLNASYQMKYDEYIRNFSLNDLENYVRDYTISRILDIQKKLNFQQKEIIICVDNGSWRYDVYPDYKWSRRQMKLKSKIDFEKMKEFFKKFVIEIENIFPWKIVKVDKCEADDVIGVLSKYIENNGEDVIIYSLDKDFVQLTSSKIRLYDIFKNAIVKEIKLGNKKYMQEITTSEHAKKYLLFQYCYGDSGDGIPNLKSDDDSFSNPCKKQTAFGPKTIINAIFSEDKEKNKENLKKLYDEYEKNFKRNVRLIDLKYTPKQLQIKIIEKYNEKNIFNGNKNIYNYCEQHGMSHIKEQVNYLIHENAGYEFV